MVTTVGELVRILVPDKEKDCTAYRLLNNRVTRIMCIFNDGEVLQVEGHSGLNVFKNEVFPLITQNLEHE